MSRAAVAIGWLVWALTLGASATINYLAGYGFGRAPIESHVFAMLGVAADLWKALGPIYIVTLVRHRRFLSAGLASIVWVACAAFAITAALGLAAQNRSGVVGTREATALTYTSAVEQLDELRRRRATISESRKPDAIDRKIDAILMRAIARVGTVGLLSENCSKDHWRTRASCAEVAELKADRATAVAAAHLDEEISKLRLAMSRLRERGGTLEADPQAQLITRLTRGLLAAEDVGLAVVLLTVVMIEIISAFAPVVLYDFAAIGRVDAVATGRDASRSTEALREAPDIYEYLADRVEPDDRAHVTTASLFLDLRDWCDSKNCEVPPLSWFLETLDEICERDLGGRVQKAGVAYRGFRLKSVPALPAPDAR